MKNHAWLKSAVASTATLLVLAPFAAQADVKVETLTHINEVTGITAHDSDTTDYFQGTKKREENLRKFTGSVLGAWQKFRGEDKGSMDIDIYLVDTNKHYDLDPQKKTYSEDAIYDPNQATKAPPEGGTTQPQKQQQDQDVKVTKNELTVKDTGKTQTINGFDTHEYVITWDYETENTKNGDTSKNLMTTDTWTSSDPRLPKAREAEMAYNKAYLQLMHIQMPEDEGKMYGFGGGTLTVNGQDEKAFFEKLRSIKGMPVSTDVTWEVGGTSAKGGTTNTGAQQARPQQNLDSALGSLFGQKQPDNSQQNQKQGTPGMTTIFSSHIEIKAIDTSPVDSSMFEVPSDYKTD
ncbi:MAG TPA: hypothetical protein VKT74_07935 [Gammaproteobacteria bacterium]|nr:hypothetical protein [Gammaproteobacteria bacterium]